MAKVNRVWGGMMMTEYGQRRCIVATATKKKACELLGMSLYEFNLYWSETGNELESCVASNAPNTVFVQRDRHVRIYIPYYAKEDK